VNHQEPPQELDLTALEALMEEQMRWATLTMPLTEIAEELASLVSDMVRFERSSSVSLLAGLLTEPAYQSTALRLELLIALSMIHSRGTEIAQIADIARWFKSIGSSRVTDGEDRAEDVFVSLIVTPRADFRVLEGLWESAGFYT
jgi:hypothetical protein